MTDIFSELLAMTRTTGAVQTPAGPGRTVALSRIYAAGIEQVWDTLTNAERIPRWFLPVTGDLRLGGHYQLEGNAGGEVLACEPPHLLRVSWVMGEPGPDNFSEVEVRLATVDGGTQLALTHTATVPPQMWETFGPGAVGVGWDLALLGLSVFLRDGFASDAEKEAFAMSDEVRQMMIASSNAWGEAYELAGASPQVAAAAVEATTAFYVPSTQ